MWGDGTSSRWTSTLGGRLLKPATNPGLVIQVLIPEHPPKVPFFTADDALAQQRDSDRQEYDRPDGVHQKRDAHMDQVKRNVDGVAADCVGSGRDDGGSRLVRIAVYACATHSPNRPRRKQKAAYNQRPSSGMANPPLWEESQWLPPEIQE